MRTIGTRSTHFSDAVPRLQDRRELRRLLRAAYRRQRAQIEADMTESLQDLSKALAPVSRIGQGPGAVKDLAFADGTTVRASIPGPDLAAGCPALPSSGACYLYSTQPCSKYWHWLHFLADGAGSLSVLARVEEVDVAHSVLRRPA